MEPAIPLIYSIDKATRIVTIEYDRNPRFVDFEKTMEGVFNEPDFESGFKILIDRHRIDEPPSTEYIRHAAEFIQKHKSKLPCLATVVKNDVTYGMVRMAHILAEGADVKMEVFTDVEKAKEWLGSC